MQSVIDKLKEIESRDIGIVIYSLEKQNIVASLHPQLSVPLASAAKVAIGYCVAKWVEEGKVNWDDLIEVCLDPKENSHELYPHFQMIESFPLRDAVEVMIACHDSMAANSIVQFCGGWELINQEIQLSFNNITIRQDPRDLNNQGELKQMLGLLCEIYSGYKTNPEVWSPIIKGLVRPVDNIEGIPSEQLNHMSGGLENVVVDVGILGKFNEDPFLYVLGTNHLPSRYTNTVSDKIVIEAMRLLYKEYVKTGQLQS